MPCGRTSNCHKPQVLACGKSGLLSVGLVQPDLKKSGRQVKVAEHRRPTRRIEYGICPWQRVAVFLRNWIQSPIVHTDPRAPWCALNQNEWWTPWGWWWLNEASIVRFFSISFSGWEAVWCLFDGPRIANVDRVLHQIGVTHVIWVFGKSVLKFDRQWFDNWRLVIQMSRKNIAGKSWLAFRSRNGVNGDDRLTDCDCLMLLNYNSRVA